MFGGQTLNELRSALAEAEAEVTGGLSPRILPMGEIRDLGGLLQRAGLALPVADNCRPSATATLSTLMADLRAMGEGQRQHRAVCATHPTRRSSPCGRNLHRHPCRCRRPHSCRFEIICLTGWCHESQQQKPLRPGSAQARLAEALNTAELPLGHVPQGKGSMGG